MKNSLEASQKRNELKAYWRETIDPATIPKYITRICKDCGEESLCRWNSSFSQMGKPEYRPRCDSCHNKKQREYKKSARGRFNKLSQDRKIKRKKDYVRYLGGSCSNCGYSKCQKALTFHHTENKRYDISQILDHSWSKVKSELDKCILLCFNCHMEEHCVLDGNVCHL